MTSVDRPSEQLNAPDAWTRYALRQRSFYFVYDHENPHTQDLLKYPDYGVVQLTCIVNEARAAFMAGYRAGKKHQRKLCPTR